MPPAVRSSGICTTAPSSGLSRLPCGCARRGPRCRPISASSRRELDSIGAGLNGALDEVGEIARGIHPAALAKGGLRAALSALARRSPIPVDLDLRAKGRLPEHAEVSAYYVVAEALTNAVRHARASAVSVEVEAVGEVLRVVVRDDGAGAPASPVAPAWSASRTGSRRTAAGSCSTARPGPEPACA